MASEEIKKQIKNLKEAEFELKQQYQEIALHPAMQDILKVLNDSYASSYSAAISELDNPAKAMAALQHANAYDKMRTYIMDNMV